MTYEEFADLMQGFGYKILPLHPDDAEYLHDFVCNCGCHSITGHLFVREVKTRVAEHGFISDLSYITVAECQNCGHYEEF